MIRAIISGLMGLLTSVTVSASELPHFNIEATCRAAPSLQGGIQNPYPSCMTDEEAALTELKRTWTTYNAGRRSECTSFGQMGNAPSYVVVLTCLQMRQ
jgi:hypothetical protein